MKTPFAFANWSTAIAFLVSWLLWISLEHTAFKWGWLSVNDGFAITSVFTITSWLRVYGLDKYRQHLNKITGENMIEKLPSISGQESVIGRHVWSVARLVHLSKDLEVMTVPLKHLNVNNSYEKLTLREMVSHMKAVTDADLSYPIILDEDGEIMDGRHRIMKALLTGTETIKAVRFGVNPRPCRIQEGT